jgi:hypothetical protein
MFGVLDPLISRLDIAMASIDCDWWIQFHSNEPMVSSLVIIRAPSVKRGVLKRTLTKYPLSFDELYEWSKDEDYCIRRSEDIVRYLKRELGVGADAAGD